MLPDAPKLRVCLRLQLRYDLSLERFLGSEWSLLDAIINDATGPAVKSLLEEQLASIEQPEMRYRRIWSRPLIKLPVWKDLPRLIGGMVVTQVW